MKIEDCKVQSFLYKDSWYIDLIQCEEGKNFWSVVGDIPKNTAWENADDLFREIDAFFGEREFETAQQALDAIIEFEKKEGLD